MIIYIDKFTANSSMWGSLRLAPINTCSLLYIVRVMEFSASITRACALQTIRTTYVPRMYVHTTYVPMPPALCLGETKKPDYITYSSHVDVFR